MQRVSLSSEERGELLNLVTQEAQRLAKRRWWRPFIGDVSLTLERLNRLYGLMGKMMAPIEGGGAPSVPPPWTDPSDVSDLSDWRNKIPRVVYRT